MGSTTSGSAIRGSVAGAVEHLTRPPARPVDLTLPASEDPAELVARAKKELKFEGIQEYNVAVVSASAAGKASFLNAFRMIEDSHAEAASVESSNEMKRYPHPLQQGVVLWDLPTAGVPGHPALTYFTDKKLYAFDCIFIVSAERFQRVDFEVAKAAVKFNMKQFAFVRAQADEAVKRVAEREKIAVAEACKRVREAVEASFREGLRLANLADKWQHIKLFFVSSKGTIEEHHEDDEDHVLHLDDKDVSTYTFNLLRNRARRTLSTRSTRSRTASPSSNTSLAGVAPPLTSPSSNTSLARATPPVVTPTSPSSNTSLTGAAPPTTSPSSNTSLARATPPVVTPTPPSSNNSPAGPTPPVAMPR